MMADSPQKKKVTACETCWKAKTKCSRKNEAQTKCDRCLRLDKPCFPHISNQGKRPPGWTPGQKKGDKEKARGRKKRVASAPTEAFAGAATTANTGNEVVINGPTPSIFQVSAGAASTASGLRQINQGDIRGDELLCLPASQGSDIPDDALYGHLKSILEDDCLTNESAKGGTSRESLHNQNQYHTLPCAQLEPCTHNWLENVNDVKRSQYPLSFASGTNTSLSIPAVDNKTQDINEQVEAFLESFEKNVQLKSPFSSFDTSVWQELSNSISLNPNVHHCPLEPELDQTRLLHTNQSLCISLKEWPAKALQCVASFNDNILSGVSSSQYLTASLKVAISLARNIDSLSDKAKVDLLGSGDQWAKQVIVRLKTQEISSNMKQTQAGSDMLGMLVSFGTDQNYLDVASAEIICPDGKPTAAPHTYGTELIERMVIYYLALVLYEMFHGGQEPPSDLRRLALLDGAFISLSTLTLVKSGQFSTDTDPKRHQASFGSDQDVSLCRLSSDCLKFVGIPGPLGDVFCNMMDCVYGELGGNECYTNMSDVTLDLQLMLDNPKLLQGFDMQKQLGNLVIPRDQEMQTILTSYRKCMSGSREIVIVKGESGAGKSTLTQCVAVDIISKGGLVLMGKFDQMQQSRPFSAVASALDQFLDLLLSQLGSDWAMTVTNKLQYAFGQVDPSYLIKVLPKLGLILGDEAADAPDINLDSKHATERLHYLFCMFVEVISTTSDVSVTLCLDDIQWADESSISLLKRLTTNAPMKFFFMACCRDDEMGSNHPFWSMIESICTEGVALRTVELKSVEEVALNFALSDLLCLLPRLVQPLSRILYLKTKGNLLFIAQMLRSLKQDGLLRIDLDRQRWVWDEEKICSAKLPDNVALCFSGAIKKLPVEVQLALHTLSMFGATTTHEIIKALETNLRVNISEPLKVAMIEGLVNKTKFSYHFTHDKIQETSYNMILEQDRLCHHLTYGRCLVQLALQNSDDDMLFIAVNQINLATPVAIIDANEYSVMANHNLNAGKKAVEMSDFNLAHSFFQCGIEFLRAQENHWIEHYNLSLELFELTAKMSLAIGNIHSIQALTENILSHATSFDDTLNAQFIIISSLVTASKINEAFERGLVVLDRLEEGLRSDCDDDECNRQLENALSKAMGMFDRILNYPLMPEPSSQSMAVKIMTRLQSPAFFSNSVLHPLLIIKMVELSVSYGLTCSSPMAFACFGSLLARRGRIDLGKKFVLLARSLLQRSDLNASDSTGEVLLVVADVLSFQEPLLLANEIRVEGEKTSRVAGDALYQSLNRMQWVLTTFHAGVCLPNVKNNIQNAVGLLKQYNQFNLATLLMMERTVNLLSGCDESESSRGNEVVRTIRENQVPRQLTTLHFHDMLLAFIFNRADLEERSTEFFAAFRKSPSLIVFADAAFTFFAGLASYRIYRKTGVSIWADRGEKCKNQMKLWADTGCSHNFEQKYHLLMAEAHFCHNNFGAAKEAYLTAIATAEKHRFLNDEAISYHLAAIFHLETGGIASSLENFRLAYVKYCEWGANDVANHMLAGIKERLGTALSNTTQS